MAGRRKRATRGPRARGSAQAPLKRMGALSAEGIWAEWTEGAYAHGQLPVEREMLIAAGMSPADADEQLKRWKRSMRTWISALANNRYPIVGGWGSASKGVLEMPGVDVIRQLWDLIASELIGGTNTATGKIRRSGVVHGSSTTGLMGHIDRAWVEAARLHHQRGVPIINIPLNWVLDPGILDVPEIPAMNGARAHRCPPQLLLSTRTEAFARPGPILYLVAPGGLGTRFEVAWQVLSAQLKNLLLTAFTGYPRIPELFLLDFEIDSHDLAQQFVGREGVKNFHGGWFWEGFRRDAVLQIISRCARQEHFQHLTILRVGKGEDVVAQDRVGPSVRYFATTQEVARFVGVRFDSAIVDIHQPLMQARAKAARTGKK